MVWLHLIADLLVWVAYLAIPITLVYFARRRRDLPFRHLFWLFGLFIIFCGLTHLSGAAMFFYPAYRLDGLIKLLTAGVSLATAAVLIPVMPRALAMRSSEDLEAEIAERTSELTRANASLAGEIAERRKAEERFRQVIEQMPNAIVMVGRDGRIRLLNAQAEALFGYARSELLAQSIEVLVPERFRMLHPGERDGFFAMPQSRAMGAGRELFALHRDGREIPVEIGLSPIETEEGMAVLAAIVDITQRRRAEEDRERFFRVSENLICIAGLDGMLKQVNPAFERLLGFSTEELLSIPYLEFVHPQDLEAALAELDKLARGMPTDHFELRLRQRSGGFRWILWNAVLHEGNLIYASGSDITEHKLSEERLLKVQIQAAELSAIKRTAATYAHEINNPLTGVLGYIQILLERDQDDPELHQMLTEALDAAVRIRNVTVKIEELDSTRTRPYLSHSELLDLSEE